LDAWAATIKPAGDQEPEGDVKEGVEEIENVAAEEVRGLREAGVGAQDRSRRLHVMRDGQDFVGQRCDVADDPEEEVGDDDAGGDEDGLFAGEARGRVVTLPSGCVSLSEPV
jgi:hypothetical protein